MSWSFAIGRLFGTEVRVHLTFFLLLAAIGASAFQQGGAAAAIETIAFILVLFACVVAHEFGHALMARRFGIATHDVTLLPIGGLARLERMPEDPREEIAVALAGPAVNVAIFILLSLIVGVASDPDQLAAFDGSGQGFWARVALLNLVLALFNLLPAFPMDGGRVLRAVLSFFTDRVRATAIAAGAGQVLAFGFGAWGLASGNIVLILVAVFVFIAAGSESQHVAMDAVARKLLARDAMISEFETLAPADTLRQAGELLIQTSQVEFPVLDGAGQVVGLLTRDALFAAFAQDQRDQSVADHMLRDVPTAGHTERLDRVLDQLQSAPAILVLGQTGRLLGYITRENLGETLVIRGRGKS